MFEIVLIYAAFLTYQSRILSRFRKFLSFQNFSEQNFVEIYLKRKEKCQQLLLFKLCPRYCSSCVKILLDCAKEFTNTILFLSKSVVKIFITDKFISFVE